MAIDFPSSPSVNDTFTVGDAIYKWDGTVWTSTVSGAVDFLPLTGGTVTGAITASGGVTGDLTGVASEVAVSDTGFGDLNNRPIACFGASADPSALSSSPIRWAATNHPTVNGSGSINVNGGLTGDISGGTLGNGQVRNAIALGGTGNLGTYALLKKVTSGGVVSDGTVSGANLRFSSAAGNSSGTPNGTWQCMGRALDDGAQTGEKMTTVWLRIS